MSKYNGNGNGLDGFDEIAYLKINCDVNEAVKSGAFLSGIEHYLKHGKAEGRIANYADLEARLHERVSDLTELLRRQENQLNLLNGIVSANDATISALNHTVSGLLNSTSWRITKPLRYIGSIFGVRLIKKQFDKAVDVLCVFRRLTSDYSFPVLLKRGVRVFRREGMRGVKSRIRTLHINNSFLSEKQTPQLETNSSIRPASIVRDNNGRYRLEVESRGYVYIEPEKPIDFSSRIDGFSRKPEFSIVVPVFNTSHDLLEAAVNSVHAQWYSHWQLILVDDASPSQETREALDRISHPQIKVLRLPGNLGISGATNAGLEVASGDFVVFMDHDDELTVDCLYELALCIDRENPDFVYSDEDKLAETGGFTEPHFKPDWSPDSMMSTMYTCHVSCIRRSLLGAIGGLRSEFDGCQDWDFVLRVAENTRRISHIPKVLYHWRIIPASIASDIAAKPYVLEASRRVREDALARRGLPGTVEPLPQMPGYFRIVYALTGEPLISIIIPTRDNERVLRQCVDSILERTQYKRLEVVILDNGSKDPATLSYLSELAQRNGFVLIRHDAPFNYSELNNIGARAASGDLLLFLNDDTEVMQDDWLERLGGYAQLSHIGAVGAKLLYPGAARVQHVGILNLEDGPGHAFLNHPAEHPGYFMRNLLEYNWLAVTGACLMVEREKFDEIGGFAEDLPVAYNDIDLCMRLRDKDYFNVVVPAVSLIHHESVSRGIDHADPIKIIRLKRDMARLYERNQKYFQHDPFHSKNLHPNGINFDIPC